MSPFHTRRHTGKRTCSGMNTQGSQERAQVPSRCEQANIVFGRRFGNRSYEMCRMNVHRHNFVVRVSGPGSDSVARCWPLPDAMGRHQTDITFRVARPVRSVGVSDFPAASMLRHLFGGVRLLFGVKRFLGGRFFGQFEFRARSEVLDVVRVIVGTRERLAANADLAAGGANGSDDTAAAQSRTKPSRQGYRLHDSNLRQRTQPRGSNPTGPSLPAATFVTSLIVGTPRKL